MNKQRPKNIVFCVTNDLIHDQRMSRICGTVANWGYHVTLIGWKTQVSKPLLTKNYRQRRLSLIFSRGKLMYLEYNIRLFCNLLILKADTIVAIDLDTIAPVYFASIIKKSRRIYDAHELFTEMKEVITRPMIHWAWLKLEQWMVPRFPLGMTVSESIEEEFNRRYGVHYKVIMNTPILEDPLNKVMSREPDVILYQGAVNEGRCLEWLIPAMAFVKGKLWICGEGNFMIQSKQLIESHDLQDKVILMGMLLPEELRKISMRATIGINLVEPIGKNQIFSLANKFFDYIHARLPQVTMNFPEYSKINGKYDIAILIDKPDIEIIAETLNNLLENGVLYQRLEFNCQKASQELNWQKESQKLTSFFPKS